MPTINLNKTVFNKLVGKELSDEELRERIPMLGTDLEKVEGDLIEVEVFPNRPDMLSEQGFARAFSSFIGEKTDKNSNRKVERGGENTTAEQNMRKVNPCIVKRYIWMK